MVVLDWGSLENLLRMRLLSRVFFFLRRGEGSFMCSWDTVTPPVERHVFKLSIHVRMKKDINTQLDQSNYVRVYIYIWSPPPP